MKNRHWHSGCYPEGMMAMLHIAMALIAAGLVVELFTAASAPLGYQDESGFHLGPEKTDARDDAKFENPS